MNIELLSLSVGILVGIVIILLYRLFRKGKEINQINKEYSEEKNKERLYMNSIVGTSEFYENYIPKIFSSLKEINLIVLSKHLNWPNHKVVTNISKKTMKVADIDLKSSLEGRWYVGEDSYKNAFSILEPLIKNDLPTYIFIEIGKDATYHQNVGSAMRVFKEKFPNIHFYIFCSSFYFYHKALVIDSLIEDGTAENIKITDSVIDHQEGLVEKIQECLS